tara:strand:- start:976 stop:1122 length:147 start_codon:yes stop_codon:yes gene_type:complete
VWYEATVSKEPAIGFNAMREKNTQFTNTTILYHKNNNPMKKIEQLYYV